MNSGTTLMVARRLLRTSVGIELNPAYCELIVDRIGQTPLDFGQAGG
jgi:DNA modification methylase